MQGGTAFKHVKKNEWTSDPVRQLYLNQTC